jgi:hypothetical protein
VRSWDILSRAWGQSAFSSFANHCLCESSPAFAYYGAELFNDRLKGWAQNYVELAEFRQQHSLLAAMRGNLSWDEALSIIRETYLQALVTAALGHSFTIEENVSRSMLQIKYCSHRIAIRSTFGMTRKLSRPKMFGNQSSRLERQQRKRDGFQLASSK